MAQSSEIIQNFTNAIYKAILLVEEHNAEKVAQSLAPHLPDAELEILTTLVERYRSIGACTPNPAMTEEGLNRLQDIMTEAGELDKRVPHSAIVNTEFAERAME